MTSPEQPTAASLPAGVLLPVKKEDELLQPTAYSFNDRDVSWLAFNYRVLQEAKDKRLPLYERIKFLAIYSSNMDEFFKIRVAYLRGLAMLKKKTQKQLYFDPVKVLRQVKRIVQKQRAEYLQLFESLMQELKQHRIFFISYEEVTVHQYEFLREYFYNHVMPLINPIYIHEYIGVVFIQSDTIYHALRFPDNEGDYVYALIEIPTHSLPRFLLMPEVNHSYYIISLDDIIRLFIHQLFPKVSPDQVYSVKMNRDAELYIYDEHSGNLVDKIKKSLAKRNLGVPSRFLYDNRMPEDFLKTLKRALGLTEADLVAGGRYHNFRDLMNFPNPLSPALENEPLPPLRIKELDEAPSIFEAIEKRDWLIHFPYQTYDYLSRFLWEAAESPYVTKIRISLYRVAVGNSKVVSALIHAARMGKEVTVFIEVKARFDEENNIKWSNELIRAGAKVFYSIPGIKVHSKTCVITYRQNGLQKRYAYFGTGNFNEKTARVYCDIGLFTADAQLTEELLSHYDFLRRKTDRIESKELLIAPHNMRQRLYQLIQEEIEAAKAGEKAYILLKMNSIQDREIIEKLYEASNAGVKIDMIVRGICCLKPGIKGQSENIRIISIVDRFLEHARCYYFYHHGKELLYCSSADFMTRNLSDRVEVAFPIKDPRLKQEVLDILHIQLSDNQKSRIVDARFSNRYVKSKGKPIRAQMAIYEYLKNKYPQESP
ncbi:MAG: polyphosphate kinase 1 [Cytophagales bacterium]|nr:polyphosphate kinase 1 [Bernardetiaceae bacterium]MDW8211656.1 polyphosphate kinase 1 [Cytophagales bacterium]